MKCWRVGSVRDLSLWHKSVPLTVGISIALCQYNDLLYISLMLLDVFVAQELLRRSQRLF